MSDIKPSGRLFYERVLAAYDLGALNCQSNDFPMDEVDLDDMECAGEA